MILCQGRVEPGQVMLPGKGVYRAVWEYGTPIWAFPVLKFVGWADFTPGHLRHTLIGKDKSSSTLHT